MSKPGMIAVNSYHLHWITSSVPSHSFRIDPSKKHIQLTPHTLARICFFNRIAYIFLATFSISIFATGADSDPSSKHGVAQLQRVLADRLQMNVCNTANGKKYIELDDEVARWVILHFECGPDKDRIFWSAKPPDRNVDADRNTGFGREVFAVYVRDKSETMSPDAAFASMWFGLVYELTGYRDRAELVEIHKRAARGDLEKAEFVRAVAKHEYDLLIRVESFWNDIWLPWSKKHQFDSVKNIWTLRRRDQAFDEWFTNQMKHPEYPKNLGDMYEYVIRLSILYPVSEIK